jgi:hypothetical protein
MADPHTGEGVITSHMHHTDKTWDPSCISKNYGKHDPNDANFEYRTQINPIW